MSDLELFLACCEMSFWLLVAWELGGLIVRGLPK